MDKKRIAIIPGHCPSAAGAVDVDGDSEFYVMQALAKYIAQWSTAYEFVYLERPEPNDIAALARIINKAKVVAAIELHFDSTVGYTGKAAGVSGQHWPGSYKGVKLAGKLSKNMAQRLGLTYSRNRGTVARRDLGLLRLTKPVTVILECYFGDNKLDTQNWKNTSMGSKLGAIETALKEYFQELADEAEVPGSGP